MRLRKSIATYRFTFLPFWRRYCIIAEPFSPQYQRSCDGYRHGSYKGHTDTILQLLVLGDHLLSLGSDRKLLSWKIGTYTEPEVRPCGT